ncbi:MAG: hypothetical protein JRH20_08840 [Deltaproteobacteria bacterium]|nr:hypothetical protein [Deltaproteobacteria bacterium]
MMKSNLLTVVFAVTLGLGAAGCSDSLPEIPDLGISDAQGDQLPVDANGLCTGKEDGDICGEGTICVNEECVPEECGDGYTNPGTSEECDDANDVEGDGCNTDCTFSCTKDEDCDDGSYCSGIESCDTITHACLAGTRPECDDSSPCTENVCDPITDECTNPLIDLDKDGQASTTLGVCGTDCNDDDGTTYAGAEEICDGKDNNCVNGIDEVAPTWYVDCDKDSFATDTIGAKAQCDAPAASVTGCDGAWTTKRPAGVASTDCDDDDQDAFPGQTTYFTAPQDTSASGDNARYGNYNCDATAQYDHTRTVNVDSTELCALLINPTFYTPMCLGSPGWDTVATVGCGFKGSYSRCTLDECNPKIWPSKECTGYTLKCLGASSRLETLVIAAPPRCFVSQAAHQARKGALGAYYAAQGR